MPTSTGSVLELPSLTAGTLAFLLFFASDLWARNAVGPLSALLGGAATASAAGAALTVAAARRRYPGYSVFAPFRGGPLFVLLQAHGWALVSGAVLAACVQLWAMHATSGWAALRLRYVLAAAGLSAFCGCALLGVSVAHYDPAAAAKLNPHVGRGAPAAAALALSVLSAVLYAAAEGDRAEDPSRAGRLVGAALGCSLAGALVTHASARGLDGWQFWQPYRGGDHFILLQAEGWLWMSVVVWVSLLGFCGIWSIERFFPGLIAMLGPVQFAANAALIASLKLFSAVPDAEGCSLGRVRSPSVRPPQRRLLSPKLAPVHADLPAAAAEDCSEEGPCGGRLPLHRMLWSAGVVLAIAPPCAATLARAVGTPLGCPQAAALVAAMFLSGPVTHISGLARHPQSFRLTQLFAGGARFVISQSFGWTLYGFGVVAFFVIAANELHCRIEAILPLVFFAQANIAISVTYFEPSAISEAGVSESDADSADGRAAHAAAAADAAAAAAAQQDAERALGVPLWAVALGVVLAFGSVAAAYASGYMGREGLGWTLFFAIWGVTAAGIHIVFTQVWLLQLVAMVLVGSETGLCIMAVCGWNVLVVWYGANILCWKERAPQRAMSGWTRWTCDNVVGDVFGIPVANWAAGGPPYAVRSYTSLWGSFPLGFITMDIAWHLLPGLAVLQTAADALSLHHVVIGYLGSRFLLALVTGHRLNIDYPRIGAFRRVRVWRTGQRPTPWMQGHAMQTVARIYGMEPPPGRSFFRTAARLETVGTLALAAITLLPQKAAVLRTLGLGHVASAEELVFGIILLTPIGLLIGCGGAALARTTMPAHLRSPPGGWARKGGLGEWGPAEKVL